MTLYLLALAMGVIAGLRAMTAPAAVSWAAYLGVLPLAGTPLSFLGALPSVIIFSLLAVAELVSDQSPKTPSRKVPPQFITRIVTGALSGAAFGVVAGSLAFGLAAGVVGAVIGTLGGAEIRGRLTRAFGRDLPAGLLEDVVAVGGAALIILLAR
ncbi:DUF4126 domain-containing protein [Phenylobacterium immobile]|uniref:DUF4126 domain-containing protein n=1 Tax=Phenylobacterium immobile TaxID=21 RepID=UPI000B2EA3B2|nr:DUF4126 domain-containing protein [Phenylobacterium immobile]